MIRKLQRRFIGISALAVAILLLIIIVPFNILFYVSTVKGFDETLAYIMKYGGLENVPGQEESGQTEAESGAEDTETEPGAMPGAAAEDTETEPGADDAEAESGAVQGAAAEDGSMTETEAAGSMVISSSSDSSDGTRSFAETRKENAQSWLSSFLRAILLDEGSITIGPETQYRTRYFLITIDENGQITSASLAHIAAVSEIQAEKLARRRIELGKLTGLVRYGGAAYYFRIEQDEDGSTQIGFLECTPELESVREVRNISILLGIEAIILFLIIIGLLSRRAIRPYVENAEAQKQFITNAGHELKTPLAIISANTEVIEMMDGKNEWTDGILQQVRRSTGLINEMIALSKMEEAEKIELTDVDMTSVVRESARSFEPVVLQQKKVFETDIEDGLKARAEEKLLTELVNILIDNAQKYCDEGGCIRVVLRKRGRSGKSGVQLLVSNDYKEGGGQDYSRFFQRFYRGDTSHNSKKAGHGIGLSMAATITEKFGGSIGASWKDGVITFTVNL